MTIKRRKAIKRLRKQVNNLDTRFDELSEELKGLKDTLETFAAQSGPKFSEEQVAMADELTDEAEEVADILDKEQ